MQDEQTASATHLVKATVAKVVLFTYPAWFPSKDENGQWKEMLIL
jgi:hypothetical protein